MRSLVRLLAIFLLLTCSIAAAADDKGKLHIICFGAHPDDCELQASGVGAMWAAQGHHVKFVSVTNGDVGHWREAGGPLARRRKAEVEKAAQILGTTVEVLDNHDGELMPTLENRKTLIRLIRQWKADVVLSPRPNDYHPDHRNTAQLVADAAYMVTVPFVCPDTPPLKRNPVFMYYEDRFQKPYPFHPDIVIDIDSVMDKKLDALLAIESQFIEGGANGDESLVPKTPEQRKKRVAEVRNAMANRNRGTANRFRRELATWYPPQQANKIEFAEAFEICEYGRQPSKEDLKKLFPFFNAGR